MGGDRTRAHENDFFSEVQPPPIPLSGYGLARTTIARGLFLLSEDDFLMVRVRLIKKNERTALATG